MLLVITFYLRRNQGPILQSAFWAVNYVEAKQKSIITLIVLG